MIKETAKHPLSGTGSSLVSKPRSGRKNNIGELDVSFVYGRNPEISSDRSTKFSEFRAFADPWCHEPIEELIL